MLIRRGSFCFFFVDLRLGRIEDLKIALLTMCDEAVLSRLLSVLLSADAAACGELCVLGSFWWHVQWFRGPRNVYTLR